MQWGRGRSPARENRFTAEARSLHRKYETYVRGDKKRSTTQRQTNLSILERYFFFTAAIRNLDGFTSARAVSFHLLVSRRSASRNQKREGRAEDGGEKAKASRRSSFHGDRHAHRARGCEPLLVAAGVFCSPSPSSCAFQQQARLLFGRAAPTRRAKLRQGVAMRSATGRPSIKKGGRHPTDRQQTWRRPFVSYKAVVSAVVCMLYSDICTYKCVTKRML